jgi:uncharacterized repeat protein (TIGR01451 family)
MARVFTMLGRLAALALVLWLVMLAGAARAQTINQYTDSPPSPIAIVDNDCSVSGTISRTINVAASYTVSDVNIGVFLTHTYRSDLRITLTSPSGTTVGVMTNTAGSGDNLNDLFDDEAASAITSHSNNGTDSTTTPPPYSHSFRPSAALSAFDGENAQGNWVLTICDSVGQDVGNYRRADLYITQPPTNYTDLSVSKVVGGGNANTGDTIAYTLTVANSGAATLDATGVTVRDILPAGLTFVSASGFGSYNSGTGNWTVGSVPIGTTRTITISATITAGSGSSITNVAEVTAQGQADLDSTPNNGVTSEDDYAAVAFTVGSRIAGTPPSISAICSAAGVGATLLDWNNHSWTAGSATGSATLANIGTVNFNVVTQGTYSAPLALNSSNTGGFGGSQLSLFQSIDYSNQAEVTTTTVTLPTAVPGAQFVVFDVDFAANDFADKLTVTGSFNGSPVTATLTNGVANYISGNAAIGDAGSGGTSANGNVYATFSSPVDTITIVYGNHTTAPANPDGQAISIYDFTFCNPRADLSVTKLSSVVSDGVSASNPKAIPGAVIRYCITVTNNGSGTATSLAATDTLPSDVTYVAGSMLSGNSCATASTPEDDDAVGGDESPIGMSISGSTITGTAVSLAPNAAFAMVFNATVD